MLQVGKPAPLFEAIDVNHASVRLQDYLGQYVLISFFRNGACALCNLRVSQLIQKNAELTQRGIQVIAVFESGFESIREYVGKQNPPFPMIPDPEAKLYALYGVETSEAKVQATLQRADLAEVVQHAHQSGFELIQEEGSNFNRMPADFLVGPHLEIIQAHHAQYVYDHLPFEEIYREVESYVILD